MATIHNEITVNASVDEVWNMLTDLELLDKYDPTVKKSTWFQQIRQALERKEKC